MKFYDAIFSGRFPNELEPLLCSTRAYVCHWLLHTPEASWQHTVALKRIRAPYYSSIRVCHSPTAPIVYANFLPLNFVCAARTFTLLCDEGLSSSIKFEDYFECITAEDLVFKSCIHVCKAVFFFSKTFIISVQGPS